MIRAARPSIGEEEVQAVRDVLLSGALAAGRNVEAFEREFADLVNARYAVAVSSGTAALHVALAALGIGRGDEVIVPPITFFATVGSVLLLQAVPVFADIDPATCCLDPADVAGRITSRTKAILPVHLFGRAADLDGLLRLGAQRGVPVVEDCSQAHGTTYRGAPVGSVGLAGTFSFYATKHMTTGEGGMITTNDPAIAEQSRLLRNHGMTGRDTHALLGHNYRMSEVAAAIGRVQLRKLLELNRQRIRNSRYLLDNLASLEWLVPFAAAPEGEHTYFWAPFLVREEKLGMTTREVVAALYQRGIEARHRYHAPLYRQAVFRTAGKDERRPYDLSGGGVPELREVFLPNAERIAGRLIGLPNHPGLRQEDLDLIIRTVRSLA